MGDRPAAIARRCTLTRQSTIFILRVRRPPTCTLRRCHRRARTARTRGFHGRSTTGRTLARRPACLLAAIVMPGRPASGPATGSARSNGSMKPDESIQLPAGRADDRRARPHHDGLWDHQRQDARRLGPGPAGEIPLRVRVADGRVAEGRLQGETSMPRSVAARPSRRASRWGRAACARSRAEGPPSATTPDRRPTMPPCSMRSTRSGPASDAGSRHRMPTAAEAAGVAGAAAWCSTSTRTT